VEARAERIRRNPAGLIGRSIDRPEFPPDDARHDEKRREQEQRSAARQQPRDRSDGAIAIAAIHRRHDDEILGVRSHTPGDMGPEAKRHRAPGHPGRQHQIPESRFPPGQIIDGQIGGTERGRTRDGGAVEPPD
jgi:hypothetical protein